MNDLQLIERLENGIDQLQARDNWLLDYDLSERSICHKLAEYLQILFSEYNVDCEYNGNIQNHNGRKKINILKENLANIRELTPRQQQIEDGKHIELSVFPDIIVHHRGKVSENKLIIEVKKSTNTDDKAQYFDLEKMYLYTSSEDGNELNYQLGAFVTLATGNHGNETTIQYFKNGVKVEKHELH